MPDFLREHQIYRIKKITDIEIGPSKQQGIVITKTGEFLSDFISTLSNLETIPDELKEKYPSLTTDDYWRALHAVVLILSSLEWNNADAEVEKNSKGKESLLKASIRHLKNYKEENGMA